LENRSGSGAQTVEQYISAQPAVARALLERVRSSIRRALPQAEEVMAYDMPTYRIGKARVIAFALQKKHLALYGKSEGVRATFASDLHGCSFEKGTVRFPLTMPIPDDLIERIARFRAIESAR
jgi:uncharacterized protein YdhG (YjbR/CyaY superfamily)